MYKNSLNEPWASITCIWANDNTLKYISHPKVPSLYNKCYHYHSSISLQFTDKQQLKIHHLWSLKIWCWCQENNYFLLKLSHFCYQFSRHSHPFLAQNFPHYLKVLRVSAKELLISTDISSWEHTYLNNNFLNKEHIGGK